MNDRYTIRDHNTFQARAIRKCSIVNEGDIGGDDDSGQLVAFPECPLADFRDAIRKIYAGQAAAAESCVLNGSHAVREGKFGQTRTITKGVLAYGGNTVGNLDGGQS